MLAELFESQGRRIADAAELDRLQRKYGDGLISELRSRIVRTQKNTRDKKHWQRLLRKAR